MLLILKIFKTTFFQKYKPKNEHERKQEQQQEQHQAQQQQQQQNAHEFSSQTAPFLPILSHAVYSFQHLNLVLHTFIYNPGHNILRHFDANHDY